MKLLLGQPSSLLRPASRLGTSCVRRAVLMAGLALISAGSALAATWRVTPADPPERLRVVVSAAKDGDVVEIASGHYPNRPLVLHGKNITLRGIGARPVFTSTDGVAAESKALWVVRAGKVVIDNIEFQGVRVPDGIGAGIRFESGHLVLNRCAFRDNEMGVLTGNQPDSTLEVRDSEFSAAPRFYTTALHHLLYIGTIASATVTGSRFHQGYQGHLLKTRARESRIFYNMLVDSSDGEASYELEFPSGGVAYVVGNIIGQSLATANPALVSYGAEGPRWPQNSLYLSHNTLLNPLPNGVLVQTWPQKFSTPIEEWALNNLIVGNGSLANSASGRSEGNYHTERLPQPADDIPALRALAQQVSGKIVAPAELASQPSLQPTGEFMLPVGVKTLPAGRVRFAGALQ